MNIITLLQATNGRERQLANRGRAGKGQLAADRGGKRQFTAKMALFRKKTV